MKKQKKQKATLNSLQVKSFVTSIKNQNILRGGTCLDPTLVGPECEA
ncbi:pinensin family lanthipeptide [Fulvivirga sp. 29W222]|uniref:Pinensin family lanthipeptide n=2 Tax=Fulvivirga marina TaxID=2494733 RepID=A0A937FTN0_9BACT|nr:pinensin family lanthipeptide [Fulvivirga marina]